MAEQKNFEEYLRRYHEQGTDGDSDESQPTFGLSFVEPEATDSNPGNEENSGTTDSQEINEFIQAQKSANTVRKTRSDMNVFYRFCESIDEHRQIENIPLNELDKVLSKFFKDVNKKDGGEYEPNTLTTFQRSIQRHLTEKNASFNILKDKEFSRSREVLSSKRKNLVKQGLGNRPNATRELTDEEVDKLFQQGQFGDHDPTALQRTMWWYMAMNFGFRARDESRKLCWGDVELAKDPETEREMLIWKADRGTKTRHGQEGGHRRQFAPKLFATGTERCPIRFYKAFKGHRPAIANDDASPFFLAVNHKRKQDSSVWYKNCPLGKNIIGQFLATAAKAAGLQGEQGDKKITNHSVRKTSISKLLDADIPENYVMQLSGHKNIQSLSSYKSASLSHQRLMSDTLNNNVESASSASETSTAHSLLPATSRAPSMTDATCSSHTQAVFAGASIGSINNCTIQIMPGPVKIIQENVVKRRRIAVIDSDEDD